MKYLLPGTLFLAFCLSACGGSSGGGGGGVAPAAAVPQAEFLVFSQPPANESGTIIDEDGNPNDLTDDYVLIQRTAEGIAFTYRDVANRDLLGDANTMRSFEISTTAGSLPSDFKASSAGGHSYQRAENVSAPVAIGAMGSGDTFVATEIIEVGGLGLGLEYADFGMWKTSIEYTEGGISKTRMNEPEVLDDMKDPAHKAGFTAGSGGSASFTGAAMGVARAHNSAHSDDVAAPLGAEFYGSASLTVDLANKDALEASLELLFPGFYDLKFSKLGMDALGDFEERAASTLSIVDHGGNATGITLDAVSNLGQSKGALEFDVDGQFYGPSRNNPSEAVGSAEIRQAVTNGVNGFVDVDIAFGVKK